MIDPTNAQNITKYFSIKRLYSENMFDQVHQTEQDLPDVSPFCTKNETLNVHIFLILALYEKILGTFGT